MDVIAAPGAKPAFAHIAHAGRPRERSVRRARPGRRARHRAGVLVAAGLVIVCTSCAAVRTTYVPLPRTNEPGMRWPPLPVDAYVTRDGVRHELAGGFMVESGDSVVFLSAEASSRASILTIDRTEVRRTFHRDSVASVSVRVDDHTPDPAGAAIGGLLALALLYVVLIRGWPWWYGW